MYQQLGNPFLGNSQIQTEYNLGGIPGLLPGGLKTIQNEQRLLAEKVQRNNLKKYLTQLTKDPIQSAYISNIVPGRGYGNTLDVGLGTKSLQSLGLSSPPNPNKGFMKINRNELTSNYAVINNILDPINYGYNPYSRNFIPNYHGQLLNIVNNSPDNNGLLSSLVNLASTPNNNSNITNSLGGINLGSSQVKGLFN